MISPAIHPKQPCSRLCPLRAVGCRAKCEVWQRYETRLEEYRKAREREFLSFMARRERK